ncbi:MAG: hypothetical protein IPJ90_14195 [Anaerolineaceae bacterium]|nr:hypothetical protein [Anaerolineaceae bacterium]
MCKNTHHRRPSHLLLRAPLPKLGANRPERSGFTLWGSQAVMVKHIVQKATRPLTDLSAALEAQGITPPRRSSGSTKNRAAKATQNPV